MTGAYNDDIKSLEEHFKESLQWSICLLRFYKLPSRIAFQQL